MGERGHTKGLLAIHRQDTPCTISGFYHVTEVGKDRPAVAYVHSLEDAQLYAAAPDMFEALSWAMAELDGLTLYDKPKQREECIARARLALSKATPTGEASDV